MDLIEMESDGFRRKGSGGSVVKLGSGFLFVWGAQVRDLKVVFFLVVRLEKFAEQYSFVCVCFDNGWFLLEDV